MTDLRKQVEGLRELSKKWRNYKPTPYEREAQPTGYIRDTYTACADELDALLAEPVEAGAGQLVIEKIIAEFRELADAKEHEFETDPEVYDDSFETLRYCANVIEARLEGSTLPLGGDWIKTQAAKNIKAQKKHEETMISASLLENLVLKNCDWKEIARVLSVGREELPIPQRARDFEAGFQTGVKKQAAQQALTSKQAEDIHRIIERHSTDVVDYEFAADDISAYLYGGIVREEPPVYGALAICQKCNRSMRCPHCEPDWSERRGR